MSIFLLLSISGITLIAVYKLVGFLYYQRIKVRLQTADLKTFLEILGTKYQYKPFANGVTRYRWNKFWIIIKSDFDYNGNKTAAQSHAIYFKRFIPVAFF